jgi:hypothetical protein
MTRDGGPRLGADHRVRWSPIARRNTRLGDFNEDLRAFGIDALRAAIRVQIAPEDVARFMALEASAIASVKVPGAAGVLSHPVVG